MLPRWIRLAPVLFLVAGDGAPAAELSAQDAPAALGQTVYTTRCASCHDQVGARIPTKEALASLSPARVLRTLDFGAMMSIAYPLDRAEREAVAAFVGKGADDEATVASPCPADRPILGGTDGRSWSGWSPTTANARFQGNERSAGLGPATVANLRLRWAYGFEGDVVAMAAPTVVKGTLFVGSASGNVVALDAGTGCHYWHFRANGPVRAATTVVEASGSQWVVFGDQIGWVYGLDARTGQARWRVRIEEHEATRLTGSLTVHEGIAFVPAASWEETRAIDPQYPCCTFRGSVTAVKVDSGAIVWKTYLVDPPVRTGLSGSGAVTYGPSGAGVWSAPTVDPRRRVVYVTTGDNYSHPASPTSDAVIALDLANGRIVWTKQTLPNDVYNSACSTGSANCPPNAGPDFDFGASAILTRMANGNDVLLAGQKSGMVYALDPSNMGQILWQARVAKGGIAGGVQWGMAVDPEAQLLFASASDVVRRQDVLGNALVGNAELDPIEGGGLTALRISDGTTVWFAKSTPCTPARPGCSPAQPGALSAISGVVFSGAMDGYLRAYSSRDGKVLWDVDTAKPYRTVNGLDATGGSLDGAGPIIVGGMVFVNSGYPRFGGAPGNVLLAFGLQ
jgi:polyvinyl alcohol dehydrogenase (cytochrome)